MPFPLRLLSTAPLALLMAAPADAVPVSFDGNLLASCVLTVGQNGTLGSSADGGTRIGSEESGGSAATLSIVATGGRADNFRLGSHAFAEAVCVHRVADGECPLHLKRRSQPDLHERQLQLHQHRPAGRQPDPQCKGRRCRRLCGRKLPHPDAGHVPAMRRAFLLLAATALVGAPAAAVGLGPLRNQGVTASDRKGFYLTLINPYKDSQRFRLAAIGWDDEAEQPRILLPVAQPRLGGGTQRRLLVIASGLKPGETYSFRVCAERDDPQAKDLIHARVCAKLIAHRLR